MKTTIAIVDNLSTDQSSYAQAVEQHQNGMAEQYGMYEQITNHRDWERRNEQMARERMFQFSGQTTEDYDMEL